MSLKRTARHGMMRVTTIAGKIARGQLLDIPDTTRVTNLHAVRRLFRTTPKSPLVPGDIVILPNQTKVLLGEHGEAWNRGLLYTHFMGLRITDQMVWDQETLVIDSVTGLETPGVITSKTIWVNKQPLRDITDSKLGVAVDVDQVVTAEAIQPGDRLDSRLVADVSTEIGLQIVRLGHD